MALKETNLSCLKLGYWRHRMSSLSPYKLYFVFSVLQKQCDCLLAT